MRTLVKYIVGKTYRPWLVRHLSTTRMYQYENILLEIPPQVFHPGFFFSTKFLLRYLSGLQLHNKTFLDLGAGSGLLGIYAAKEGANVTAIDINPVAVAYLQKNRRRNEVEMQVIQSDLFDELPPSSFDLIAINPPYYKRTPYTDADYAWYCGEEGEYFGKLFASMKQYMHSASQVFMVLCDGCDLDMIIQMAGQHGFYMECVCRKKTMIEENFIFKISVQ